ncbi:MAG: HlyD family efflux transporter periplasmic adaptor subunit [Ignavibacteriae bacterium]|nr:MAG: HlyD family efflux transporter periplasmic adaptor subunit [Ignavibacteriota bacterium]
MKNIVIIILCSGFLFGCASRDGETITASGTIEATEVTLSAQAGGQVIRVIADEGDQVRLGDTLLIIDKSDWQYQLDQARGGYEMAVAQLRLSLKGAREEDVIQSEANYKNADADLQRMEELFRGKTISQKQLDDARTRFTISQQIWEKTRRGSRKEEIETARARRDQAKAQMASLQKKVNDCIVTAQAVGTVTKRFVEQGELAGVGMALYRISNLSTMDITIYVSELDLPRVKLNQKAAVSIDAFQNKVFEGKVTFISSTAEFTPKNIQTKDERTKLVFSVKVKVPNPDGTLKAGIPADVSLQVAER